MRTCHILIRSMCCTQQQLVEPRNATRKKVGNTDDSEMERKRNPCTKIFSHDRLSLIESIRRSPVIAITHRTRSPVLNLPRTDVLEIHIVDIVCVPPNRCLNEHSRPDFTINVTCVDPEYGPLKRNAKVTNDRSALLNGRIINH